MKVIIKSGITIDGENFIEKSKRTVHEFENVSFGDSFVINNNTGINIGENNLRQMIVIEVIEK